MKHWSLYAVRHMHLIHTRCHQFLQCLNDSTPEVRDAAFSVLAAIAKVACVSYLWSLSFCFEVLHICFFCKQYLCHALCCNFLLVPFFPFLFPFSLQVGRNETLRKVPWETWWSSEEEAFWNDWKFWKWSSTLFWIRSVEFSLSSIWLAVEEFVFFLMFA